MITVADLIAQLQTQTPTDIVVLQKDGEGNGYSPLAGADAALYNADSTWSGEVYRPNDEDGPKDGVRCVVLYPVN